MSVAFETCFSGSVLFDFAELGGTASISILAQAHDPTITPYIRTNPSAASSGRNSRIACLSLGADRRDTPHLYRIHSTHDRTCSSSSRALAASNRTAGNGSLSLSRPGLLRSPSKQPARKLSTSRSCFIPATRLRLLHRRSTTPRSLPAQSTGPVDATRALRACWHGGSWTNRSILPFRNRCIAEDGPKNLPASRILHKHVSWCE